MTFFSPIFLLSPFSPFFLSFFRFLLFLLFIFSFSFFCLRKCASLCAPPSEVKERCTCPCAPPHSYGPAWTLSKFSEFCFISLVDLLSVTIFWSLGVQIIHLLNLIFTEAAYVGGGHKKRKPL